MLVLSRKLGEKIVIDDQIVVTVVKLEKGQVRLGIEAPREIPVFREEIAPRRQPLIQPMQSEGYPGPTEAGPYGKEIRAKRIPVGNRGAPSVREGHGTDAVGSRVGHRV